MRVEGRAELRISIQAIIHRFRDQLSPMPIDPGQAITHQGLREQVVACFFRSMTQMHLLISFL
jgi:hypothetical protein